MLSLMMVLIFTSVQAQEYTWDQLSIGGGGYVTGVIVHPTEPNLVYCRTDVGGAYKYNFSSGKWEQLITADAMPAEVMNLVEGEGPGVARARVYSVASIAVDPSNANILYAACGENSGASHEGVVLKSTNRGASFIRTNLTVPISGNTDGRVFGERLAVDPNNSNVVYFGSRNQGLWVSTNGGIDWSQVSTSQVPVGKKFRNTSGVDMGISSVIFDDASGTTGGKTSRIYVASSYEGIYMSENAGSTSDGNP